eukprot:TRINITY_DN715_c3_g3_i5.p1 TRINITY_DN715_c3_g3~~TRINITY_DN715_c3_g3_i5.p1  ORF type:complete len:179 (-),score=33.88 TRINITY_DN715_c3_g3_i5:113-649(-)
MQSAALGGGRRLGKLRPQNTLFMLCDVQERFRNTISHFPSVTHVASTMLKAAPVFEIPVIVTEQYPKALGHTVAELPVGTTPNTNVFAKLKFSMLTDEVRSKMRDADNSARKSVVLFGIEAHVCVLQTALDLLEEDYDVHILADGTSSSRTYERDIAFKRLRKESGVYITTSELEMPR